MSNNSSSTIHPPTIHPPAIHPPAKDCLGKPSLSVVFNSPTAPQILQKTSGSGGIHIHNKELDDFFKENIIYNPENVLLNAVHEIKQGRNNYVNFTSLQKEMDSINECMKDALKANKELQKSLKAPVIEKFLSKQLNIAPVGGEFSCEFCGFSCNTSKGVVTHKRNCLKNPLSKKNKLISEEPKDQEEEEEEEEV